MSREHRRAGTLLIAGAVWAAGASAQVPIPLPQSVSGPVDKTVGAGGSPAVDARKPAPVADSGPAVDGSQTGPITRPMVRLGDEWIYRRQSGSASVLLRQRVVALTENGISLMTEVAGSVDTTTAVHDRQWALLGSGYNTYSPALGYYVFPLYSGKRWRIESSVSNFGADQTSRIQGEGSAVGFEMVQTPAGRFLALRVVVQIDTSDPGDVTRTVQVRETHWYSRDVLRPVKVESVTRVANEAPRTETVELISFRLE